MRFRQWFSYVSSSIPEIRSGILSRILDSIPIGIPPEILFGILSVIPPEIHLEIFPVILSEIPSEKNCLNIISGSSLEITYFSRNPLRKSSAISSWLPLAIPA